MRNEKQEKEYQGPNETSRSKNEVSHQRKVQERLPNIQPIYLNLPAPMTPTAPDAGVSLPCCAGAFAPATYMGTIPESLFPISSPSIFQILVALKPLLPPDPDESVLPLLTRGRLTAKSIFPLNDDTGDAALSESDSVSSSDTDDELALLAGDSDGGVCTMSWRKAGSKGAGACTEIVLLL